MRQTKLVSENGILFLRIKSPEVNIVISITTGMLSRAVIYFIKFNSHPGPTGMEVFSVFRSKSNIELSILIIFPVITVAETIQNKTIPGY